MSRLVDVDDVLDLFGCSDEDIYGKYTIEDALYDGSLKTTKVVRCKECAYLTDMGFCAYNHIDANTDRNVWVKTDPDDFCSRGEKR